MSDTPKTDALREVIIGQYKEDELTGNGMGNILSALTDIETLERERECECKCDVDWPAALSGQFPNDEFVLRYVEFGMGFAGTAHISNGVSHEEDTDDNDEINQFAVEYFGYDMEQPTEGDEP